MAYMSCMSGDTEALNFQANLHKFEQKKFLDCNSSLPFQG